MDNQPAYEADLGSITIRRFIENISNGLFLCSIGDFLLHMEGHAKYGGEAWFLAGLLAYLVGHIFLINAFSKKQKELRAAGWDSKPKFILAIACIYASAVLYTIVPAVKDKVTQVGVVFYGITIGIMAYKALVLQWQEFCV